MGSVQWLLDNVVTHVSCSKDSRFQDIIDYITKKQPQPSQSHCSDDPINELTQYLVTLVKQKYGTEAELCRHL